MATKIFFDMDGTIADLYNYPDWLDNILAENDIMFKWLAPMYSYSEMLALQEQFDNCELEIITWTPMNASPEYCQKVEEAKRIWIEGIYPGIFSRINVLPYGVPKQYAHTTRAKNMILVDDNQEVLAMWNTPTNRKSILRTPDMTIDNLMNNIEQMVK